VETPWVGTVAEQSQAKVKTHERVVSVDLAENRVILGSWHTAERAWWMFAEVLVEASVHHIDLVEALMEEVQMMVESVEALGRTLRCSYAAYPVVEGRWSLGLQQVGQACKDLMLVEVRMMSAMDYRIARHGDLAQQLIQVLFRHRHLAAVESSRDERSARARQVQQDCRP
jgi:hypothetical protein